MYYSLLKCYRSQKTVENLPQTGWPLTMPDCLGKVGGRPQVSVYFGAA